MAKKKKTDEADVVSDLLEAAQKASLPSGYFDGDVDDECRGEADDKAKAINAGTLMGQLEYLLERGYHPSRLKDLIENANP